MYEEAVSSSTSILKKLLIFNNNNDNNNEIEIVEYNDMLESAAMVFVQSLKELGRSSNSSFSCFIFVLNVVFTYFCFVKLMCWCVDNELSLFRDSCEMHL